MRCKQEHDLGMEKKEHPEHNQHRSLLFRAGNGCFINKEERRMLTRLEPPIPLNTVKGSGYAFAVIDYSFESDLIWVVALDESREIWCVPNAEVRMQQNWTAGRRDGVKD